MTLSVIFVATALLLVGLAAGFILHRSDFCMAGAFRDLFLFRSTFMLRPLLLLVIVAAVLFEIERQIGLVRSPFPFFGAPTLFSLIGGILFGLGMVLSGGCVIGILYKLGGGSRLALIALVGMVLGSGLYAEMHQYVVPLARKLTFTRSITLPQLTGVSPLWWVLGSLLFGGSLLWRWQQSGQLRRTSLVAGYLQPWRAALLLAVLLAVSAAVAGVPFGVTTSYLKWMAWIEQLWFPAHVASLPIYNAQPVQMSLPFAADTLSGGAGPSFDAVALMQFPLIGGIILGAAFSSWRLREWSWHGQVPFSQMMAAFAGGLLMAFGSRLTPGCNVWHLWGGLPIFALQSILFVVGLLPGAWLGGRVVSWIVLGKEMK
jgi:uncharacterized membrane protein YedE/YeeE